MKKSIAIAGMVFSVLFLSNEKTANAQGDTAYSYTGTVQTFTVPCTTTITITASGGQGGGSVGGNGATLAGTFSVTPGHVLFIVVAGKGGTSTSSDGNGGGGGSFVYDSTTSTLLIAAGGGGGSYWSNGYAGGNGGTDIVGNTCPPGGGFAGNGAAGTGGNGGAGGTGTGPGAGGAGWLSNGGNVIGSYSCSGGMDMINGFTGGAGYDVVDEGGYGGGGGGGYDAGGGGGGYNGGGGGNDGSGNGGDGGASYLNGTLVDTITATHTGNGSVTISWSNGGVLTAGKIINNVMCNGGNDGSAFAIVSGGVRPYTYSWAPSASTGDTAAGLSAGTYTLTVTDGCGQTAMGGVNITQPAAWTLHVSITSEDTGTCQGSAMVTVSGGKSPYTYSWSGGGTTNTISGKCAGTYCCTITDSMGCTDNICATIVNTGIQNISNASRVKIYPNPNTGYFTVSGLKHGEVIELYNYMGQKLESRIAENSNTMQFDMSARTNGIYLLKIETQNGELIAEKQVMKQ